MNARTPDWRNPQVDDAFTDDTNTTFLVLRRTPKHVWFVRIYSDGSRDEETEDMPMRDWLPKWQDVRAVRATNAAMREDAARAARGSA